MRAFCVLRGACFVAVTVLLSGCGFLNRTPNQFYSLQPIRPVGAAATAISVPVGIDGVELPPGVDRRGIVVRGADHKLEVRGTHQWASPLEDMVMHTLAFNLANRLPEGMVVLPGQVKPAGAMRSIYVMFEDLAPGADRMFILDARWTISARGAVPETRHERITVQLDSMDSERIASGMSEALAALADRIAAGL